MPKRQSPSSASSPTKKRRTAQTSLDSFFTSPTKQKLPLPSTTSLTQAPFVAQAEIIDVDALDISASTVDMENNSPSHLLTGRSPSQNVWNLSSTTLEDYAFPLLSTDPAQFDVLSIGVAPNRPIPYSFLTHTLLSLSNTRSRTAILNILVNTFRAIILLDSTSLLHSIYLLTNTLGPSYNGIELGIGGSLLSAAIQSVSGLSPASLRKLYQKSGDMGDVAMAAKSNIRTLRPLPPLTVSAVFESMVRTAECKGAGQVKQRQKIIEKLMLAARGEEVRFLVRTLSQNLRVGAVRTSILTALARAVTLLTAQQAPTLVSAQSSFHATEELLRAIKPMGNGKDCPADPAREKLHELFRDSESRLKAVYAKHPNFDDIVGALLASGLDNIETLVPFSIGIPLMPCLGSPTRSLDEIYDRLTGFDWVAEWKYDGQRAQIHAHKDITGLVSVRLFSRHLEDMTSKYPDVVSLIEEVFATDPSRQSFVIDSEIVAVGGDGSLRSFQDLSNRPRKDVQIKNITIPVAVYAFDLMYLDNESLIDKPFRERRTLLHSALPQIARESPSRLARLCHVQWLPCSVGRQNIEQFFQKAANNQCEGLMVKILDNGVTAEDGESSRKKPLPATYEPDRRTTAWLKLKKDYLKDADSLDMVPVAAWHGQGRKNKWWSPILLAVRNSSTGRLTAVCKCMSGFSDTFYQELLDRYPAEESDTTSKTNRRNWNVEFGGWDGSPDIYFKPSEVWEIRGAELTLSPVSTAAKGLLDSTRERGLSLRFPRFLRVRVDKSEPSDEDFLALMWRSQQRQGIEKKEGNDEGDLIDAEDPQGETLESEESDEDE
ncbi:DNA ligase [Flagelloscypha sp. PMI_526]|nr:DNA ligase [Flagelloscypha sp. PMI_526]